MANVSLAWPNLIDATVVSGGSWMAGLPLTNVQNRRISKVARSSNALTSSTIINLAQSATPASIGVLALVVHNMSVVAKVRIRGDDAADFLTPVYDSGWMDVWPAGVIPQELLEWEDDNFWLGTVSQNAIAGYRAPFTHYLPEPSPLRYWRIEIDDTGNSDGWIQVGRVFLGKVWSPEFDMNYGMSLGYSDATASETSLTGEEFFDVRTRYREHKFDLGFLSQNEAFAYVFDMQQQLGTSGELLISADRDDTENTPRTCFLGQLSSIAPIIVNTYKRWSARFEVREIL